MVQTYTKEMLKEKLSSDRKWIERAIIVVFNNQTLSEQNSGETINKNGVGFTGADADILTSFANWIKKGMHLSEKQMNIASKKIPKYHRQILAAINEKESMKQVA